MRRIVFFFLIIVCCTNLCAQNANRNSLVGRINDIKKQSDIYFWDQYTHPDADTAKIGSVKRIIIHIESSLNDQEKFSIDEILPYTEFISINRGNLKQYFAYIKKSVAFAIKSGGMPSSVSETLSNTIGESQMLSAVINQGSTVGNEIAFIANATVGSNKDMTIQLASESKAAAEEIMKNMSSGNGRFTAAIANSMARSYIGDHTIYPDVFQGHEATSSVSIKAHLSASSGDPYAYLTDILVPMFFIFGLGLPQLSSNNASAYSYPPVVQCNIPGVWGTRLGMIESISVTKNPNGKDVSINIHWLLILI